MQGIGEEELGRKKVTESKEIESTEREGINR